MGLHLRHMWHQSQLLSHELNAQTSFKDIFMVFWSCRVKSMNYIQSYMAEDKGVPSLQLLMIWNCQSCVECVIAFSGDCSKLFPIVSTFFPVSTFPNSFLVQL